MHPQLPSIRRFAKLSLKGIAWLSFIGIGLLAAIVTKLTLSLSVESTPTCLAFEITNLASSREEFRSEIGRIANRHELGEQLTTANASVWASSRARIGLTYHETDTGAFLSACDVRDGVDALLGITAEIQTTTLPRAEVRRATLQRNDKVFRCDPECVQQVAYPINLQEVERTLRRIPP